MVKIKTDFKGDIRVLRQPACSMLETLTALQEHCKNCYGFTDIKQFDLRYLDDEQDFVTISGILDLKDALTNNQSGKAVKIFVVSKNDKENDNEEKVEMGAENENVKPEPRPFWVEIKENNEFKEDFLSLIEDFLKELRSQDKTKRDILSALTQSLNNHSLIATHPDVIKIQPFFVIAVQHIQPFALFLCALDPDYVREIFDFIVSKIDDGTVKQIFPVLCEIRATMKERCPCPCPNAGGAKFAEEKPKEKENESLKPVVIKDNVTECICGDTLSVVRADHCYPRPDACAVCDFCGSNINGTDKLWHCPKNKSKNHANGYDLCFKCCPLQSPASPVYCMCGVRMICSTPNKCYRRKPLDVFCDLCNKTVAPQVPVYHCNKGMCGFHAQGYDVCVNCVSLSMRPKVIIKKSAIKKCNDDSSDNVNEGKEKKPITFMNSAANLNNNQQQDTTVAVTGINQSVQVEMDDNMPLIPKEVAVIKEEEIDEFVIEENNNSNDKKEKQEAFEERKEVTQSLINAHPALPPQPRPYLPKYMYQDELEILIGMGFEEEKIKEALKEFEGNVQRAANHLLR